MTIFNIAKLPLGSFGGAGFSYQESTTEGGRKTITHEYPNTTGRLVEDMGGLEKKFSITAWTDDNVSDTNRDNLITALDKKGNGVLIHPRFGSQTVTCIGYSIVDNISQLGISKFTIAFEVATLNTLPIAEKASKGFLANLKTSLLGENETAFNSKWASVKNAKSKFDSAVATTKNAANEIKRVSQLIQGSADTFSDFTTSINEIVSSVNSLVQTPAVLSSKITTAFNNLSVAYNSSQDVFDVTTSLFGSNSSDRNATGNSQTNQDITTNQDQINNIVNSSAMALAMNAAATIDYQTLDDVTEVNSAIEDGFALLTNLDKDVYKILIEMRVQLNFILSDLSVSLPRVTNLTVVNKASLISIVYGLYGSLDLKSTIRDLNGFTDTSAVSGDIKILSNV